MRMSLCPLPILMVPRAMWVRVNMQPARQVNLPPCGGDARQGRGGCLRAAYVAELPPPPSVAFGDISPTRGEISGSLPPRRDSILGGLLS